MKLAKIKEPRSQNRPDASDPSEVEISAPSEVLKELAPMSDTDLDDVLVQTAASINKLKPDYKTEITRHLEGLSVALKNAEDPESDWVSEVRVYFNDVRSLGGLFDYELITDVARNAVETMDLDNITPEKCLECCQAHLTSLNLIHQQGWEGDGGEAGQQLLVNLVKLCKQ